MTDQAHRRTITIVDPIQAIALCRAMNGHGIHEERRWPGRNALEDAAQARRKAAEGAFA